ncbi:hypothetical protein J4457_03470 [Candidatus Woesearchaeota archaeon]|nr:hypothetical protein [Candidatus Woesearchaeota archaeon]
MDWPILAELCGIILGDGSLHRTENRITIVGIVEDKHYFKNHVTPLFKEIFPEAKIYLRKNNQKQSFTLTLENKKIFSFFINDLDMHRGNKSGASVPHFIFDRPIFVLGFLRGIFDTDGSIKFSKQRSNINYYPRLQISIRESHLARAIGVLLVKLDFPYSQWVEDNSRGYGKNQGQMIYYQISGQENFVRWMNLVKPANFVHVTKYLLWKRYYFCIPKTTLHERLAALEVLL